MAKLVTIRFKFHLLSEKRTLGWDNLQRTFTGLVVAFGALAIGMAYLMSQLGGSILQISFSLGGIIGGPTLGLYTMGIFFPFANSNVSF